MTNFLIQIELQDSALDKVEATDSKFDIEVDNIDRADRSEAIRPNLEIEIEKMED